MYYLKADSEGMIITFKIMHDDETVVDVRQAHRSQAFDILEELRERVDKLNGFRS